VNIAREGPSWGQTSQSNPITTIMTQVPSLDTRHTRRPRVLRQVSFTMSSCAAINDKKLFVGTTAGRDQGLGSARAKPRLFEGLYVGGMVLFCLRASFSRSKQSLQGAATKTSRCCALKPNFYLLNKSRCRDRLRPAIVSPALCLHSILLRPIHHLEIKIKRSIGYVGLTQTHRTLMLMRGSSI
jgi:hypothetical protein